MEEEIGMITVITAAKATRIILKDAGLAHTKHNEDLVFAMFFNNSCNNFEFRGLNDHRFVLTYIEGQYQLIPAVNEDSCEEILQLVNEKLKTIH